MCTLFNAQRDDLNHLWRTSRKLTETLPKPYHIVPNSLQKRYQSEPQKAAFVQVVFPRLEVSSRKVWVDSYESEKKTKGTPA